MDVREKLVELLKANFYDEYEFEEIADILIAHGVTVQENCKACAEATQNCIVKLQEQIAELRSVQEWISVKDRLPEDGEIVLVCGSRCGVYTAVLNKPGQYKGWHKLNSKSHYCDPTHWMPLPEPPKEGAEDG